MFVLVPALPFWASIVRMLFVQTTDVVEAEEYELLDRSQVKSLVSGSRSDSTTLNSLISHVGAEEVVLVYLNPTLTLWPDQAERFMAVE